MFELSLERKGLEYVVCSLLARMDTLENKLIQNQVILMPMCNYGWKSHYEGFCGHVRIKTSAAIKYFCL